MMYRVVLLLALAVLPLPVNACIVAVEADLADIRKADLVIVGSVTDYTVFRGHRGGISDRAFINVRVHRTLRGRAGGWMRFELDNSTFEVSPELIAYEPALIAATWDDPWSSFSRQNDNAPFTAPRPSMMTVMRPPCAATFILPAPEQEHDGIIQAALAGGSLEWDDFARISDAKLVFVPAEYRAAGQPPVWWPLFAIVLAVTTIPWIALRRSRRKI